MARLYVSYRSTEEPFVRSVMEQLDADHDVRIDYKIPVGADWRNLQLDELRTSDVFLVFISEGTRASDFQNAEIGGARFSSAFLDGKLILPVAIDDARPPRPLDDIDYLVVQRRDPIAAARQIVDVIARRTPRIRLFISHAHSDADIASRLVDVLNSGLEMPPGELRCTSVPGYKLDLGAMAPELLRRELGSSACVVALLTPNSLGNDWVLFELGAAWANAKVTIPLLVGSLQNKDIPGPLRGVAGGHLSSPSSLDQLINQLSKALGWRERSGPTAQQKRYDLVEYLSSKTFRDTVDGELKAGFAAKRARIGMHQGQLLDFITGQLGARPYLKQEDLEEHVPGKGSGVYYRLEQLRLLGFVDRVQIGNKENVPLWGWTLAPKYRAEIGM